MHFIKNILFINFAILLLCIACSQLKIDSTEIINSNIVMPTNEYSLGFNRIVFSVVNNEGSESKKPLTVSVKNVKTNKLNVIDPVFLKW